MSRKMRLLLSGVALLVILAMAWFFLISPLRSEIASTNASITEEQAKVAAAQTKLSEAQSTREEGKKNQARLLELAKMVPDSTEVPSLLVQIQDLADQAGIDFLSVSPGAPTASTAGQGFEIVPIQLMFSGTYFDLSDFAYRVEQLVAGPGRLLTVKSIQLSLGGNTSSSTSGSPVVNKAKSSKSSPDLNISMLLYAFCMDQGNSGSTTAGSATPANTNVATASNTVATTTTK